MRLFTRLIVCAAAAMLLSALMFYVADSWFGGKSSVAEVYRQFVRETMRAESLKARDEMVARCRSAKYDTIDQILSGRLRLHQAIIQFQRANELVENVNLELIPSYRTLTSPEGVGRQVLVWTRNAVQSWPTEKAQRLLSELECQYRTLFHGAKPDADPVSHSRRSGFSLKWAGVMSWPHALS
jgi:hypothetical protein